MYFTRTKILYIFMNYQLKPKLKHIYLKKKKTKNPTKVKVK